MSQERGSSQLPRLDNGTLPIWIDKQPVFYIDGVHRVLCPVCANLYEQTQYVEESNRLHAPVSHSINYNSDDLYCQECNQNIPCYDAGDYSKSY